MKVLVVMPVKNEAWVLRTTLPSLKKFSDGIIALDGDSRDESRDLLKAAGATVIAQGDDPDNFSGWRQRLLSEARRQSGTHLVWLDADEAFTSNFLPHFRNRLEQMKPGQKLVLDWLCLWKDARSVRSDPSIWKKLPKDFVFCDDGVSQFDETRLHERRTPGTNEEKRLIRIPRSEGAVLHFQFVPFRRFQIKQTYQIAREFLMTGQSASDLNAKYSITLDSPRARTRQIPDAWIEGLTGLEGLKNAEPGWHLDGVLGLLDQHGPKRFEPIAIWHVPEYLERFRKSEGRDPVLAPAPRFWLLKQWVKDRLRPLTVLLRRWPK